MLQACASQFAFYSLFSHIIFPSPFLQINPFLNQSPFIFIYFLLPTILGMSPAVNGAQYLISSKSYGPIFICENKH